MLMIARRVCNAFQVTGIRCFSGTVIRGSGHNRWSKIKHDKAKVDATVTKQRSAVAEELRQASKRTIHLTEVQTPKPAANSSLEYGSDPQINPRLAAVIASAKRIGFAKASIENAIARGQGVSPSGAALENVTIEAMVPPSVAVIIECQTDSRLRTLSDVRLAVKEAGGTVTPTNHLFNRKGKIICKNPEGMEEEDIFDRAIEAGAVDIELENDGSVIIYAESNETTAVANAVAKSSSLRVTNTDIIWDPKEDMMVDVTTPEALNNFLDRIHDDSSVQNVYLNAT